MKVKSESEAAQSCPTLSSPVDYSLPGSSVGLCRQAQDHFYGPRINSVRVLQFGCWEKPRGIQNFEESMRATERKEGVDCHSIRIHKK